eukprot:Blabericola_migrator_1__7225@NODE_366_length_9388_cov_56_375818_g293_i0_p1_GENE_NODE_366_length_9388_cov_56_375818_g293_i0NODE_366_length_9388_cov_56_375818_g293_i0_p1_ORF_typecomplete_len1146_score168_87Peptidase_S15/PF02129_18/7_8e25Hydrolase_4/PF12146_8/1_6e05Abhydrolase_6/PF12697_7/2_9e05Abhydrolase_6/PF12697_7/5_1e03PepX_C/PF08530_10/0_00073Abhydrolase_1/PF00561_20/0_048DUF1100/PF06500_11/0_088_NODE_366_length_9388_cov_56_375818_g293_i046578094
MRSAAGTLTAVPGGLARHMMSLFTRPTHQENKSLEKFISDWTRIYLESSIVYLILRALTVPLWDKSRTSSYDVLADPAHYIVPRPIDQEFQINEANFLSLVVPHGVNNSDGFQTSLSHALDYGVLLSALVVMGGHLLLKVLVGSQDKRGILARYCLSLVAAFEFAFLVVNLSGAWFGMTTNFKLPHWPGSVWPQVMGSTLATAMALGTSSFDLRPLADLENLNQLEILTDWSGLKLLRSMTKGSLDLGGGRIKLLSLALFGALIDWYFLFRKFLLFTRFIVASADSIGRQGIAFKRILFGPLLYIGISLSIAFFYLIHTPSCTMTDTGFEINNGRRLTSEEIKRTLVFTRSFVTEDHHPQTHDPLGHHIRYKRLAIDVYLPYNMVAEFVKDPHHYEGSPTFFSATRYNRRMILRWPFTGLSVWGQSQAHKTVAIWTWPMTRGLLESGLPVIIVDTRGSGSSEGFRAIDLDVPEISDLLRVIKWVRKQWWSDGYVVGGGVSYDGMTSMKIAATDPEALNMTAPLFSPLKPVEDLFVNNGLPCRSFTEDYSGLTKGFERDGTPLKHMWLAPTSFLPIQAKLGFLFSFRTPAPPVGWEGTFSLHERVKNWDMKGLVDRTSYVDDTIQLGDGRKFRVSDAGVSGKDLITLATSPRPTYWAAGQCDHTAPRRTRELYQLLDHKAANHRVVIGPWGHGGRRGCGGMVQLDGTWACGEQALFRDLADFVYSHGETGAGIVNYVAGAGYRPFVSLESPQSLVFKFSSEPASVPMTHPTHLSLNIAHLASVPEGLLYDIKLHLSRRDIYGVAHDLTEILLVMTSRATQFITSLKALSHAMWDIVRHEPSARHPKLPLEVQSSSGHLVMTPVLDPDTPATPLSLSDLSVVPFTPRTGLSSVGSLSRWTIVQHLMRVPIDTAHVIACTLKLRSFLDRARTKIWSQSVLPSTVVFTSHPLEKAFVVDGNPRLQLPLWLSRRQLHRRRVDASFIAVLQQITVDESDRVRTRYLSEGHGLLSLKAPGTWSFRLVHNATSELPAILSDQSELTWRSAPSFQRENLKDLRQIITVDDDSEGALALMQVEFETVSAVLGPGSRLQLIILPEDSTNYPWSHLQKKYAASLGQRVSKLNQWNLLLEKRDGFKSLNTAWLRVPLG